MSDAARVSSIDALKEFRTAVAEFRDLSRSALASAQAEVQRTVWWIGHEQLDHWRVKARKRAAGLAQAKAELFRAEMNAADQGRRPTTERMAVEKAKRLVEEAETRIASIRRWSRILEREMTLYKAQCQQLNGATDSDLPRAMARLDAMVDALERYVRLAAPRTGQTPQARGHAADESKREEAAESDE